ncbi:hypothetical protein COX58_00890 [archaeon CG_4_10_14_0_2_um_filter_Archaea_38_6]|nr:MAG: hypothetical protein COS64_02870 [archaeon CG06_land_8_20_14_3_00_37_11]PJA22914.1 MAG: hypothetical protein COX58_00890 [archaeon CG_4_10_14_0_2_um_filter_Archaea_38_6]
MANELFCKYQKGIANYCNGKECPCSLDKIVLAKAGENNYSLKINECKEFEPVNGLENKITLKYAGLDEITRANKDLHEKFDKIIKK